MSQVNDQLADLWREWFKLGINPIVRVIYVRDLWYCPICDEINEKTGRNEFWHKDGCIYARAKALIEAE